MPARLSGREKAAVVADVLAPLAARGVLARRPRVVEVLDRLDADRRAVRRFQSLRERHGAGPVLLASRGRTVALVLDPGDVRRVLEGSPEPFATANLEKRAALSHFEPHGVLISHGPERAERRRFNEEALDTAHSAHRLAGDYLAKVADEADGLVDMARRFGSLGWDEFAAAWWRLVRRVALGDGARDDHRVTDLLQRLRMDANWACLRPPRRGMRREFIDRLRAYLRDAAPGSLAGHAASIGASASTVPEEQVPQWLFAFDAAGMAAFRTLALLDAHPREAERAREEAADGDRELPFLRACVLESIRLWPTTPAILRDTTEETSWRDGTLPAGTAVLVFVPFFHRDDERLPFANDFRPDLWLDGDPGEWPLVPFSQGPGECPGRNVVMLLTSAFVSKLVGDLDLSLPNGRRLEGGPPLPATLSPFGLRFHAAARARDARFIGVATG